MASLHCMCIFCVEWTSLLIDHDSILFQRIVTISIEFAGKQSFRWAKRIRRIYDNKIIFCLASSDKTECIFVMKMYSSVIQSACIFRKVCTTCLDNHRIHFYQINVTDPVVSGQLTDNAAISGTNYHYLFCFFMDRHRHMRDHLIINKFVTFCQHYISVQSQNTAKFRCLKKYQFSDNHSVRKRADGLPGYCVSHPVYGILKTTFPLLLPPCQNIQFQNIRIFRSGHITTLRFCILDIIRIFLL